MNLTSKMNNTLQWDISVSEGLIWVILSKIDAKIDPLEARQKRDKMNIIPIICKIITNFIFLKLWKMNVVIWKMNINVSKK